jgi:serine/threonine protein kinase
MTAPLTSDAFLELVRKSGLIEQDRLDRHLERRQALAPLPTEPMELATDLIRDGFLTYFQAKELLKGKHRGFTLGKYKVLERIGSGGNGSVFLCEHTSMRRKVALKILPLAKAEDPSSLARFYREARAGGTLDHPNLVRTFDNGQEGDYHFLVMEYVDGCCLEGIVGKHGPMDIGRAAAYIRQAAVGLQHLHKSGLIHRDIKPGNILLERRGIVKILDLGLARFFHDHKDMLTQQYNNSAILGTADYLSPEQALNSHDVDTRTDIYSLGTTLYFLLAGRPPFEVKAVSQKLLAHLTKAPTPVQELRPEIPKALAAIVDKMMAKNREHRYQTPAEVVVALAPWTETRIAPPPAQEMPQLSPAAQRAGSVEASPVRAGAARATRSARRKSKEQGTSLSHTGFDGQRARTEAATALAERGQPGRSSRSDLPPGSDTDLIPDSPVIPENEDRARGKRPAADTVNSVAGSDTRTDLAKRSRRRPDSEQTAPAKPAVWRKEQLRTLAGVSLVAAVISGVALGVLCSKPASKPDRKGPFPGITVPEQKMNLRSPSDEEDFPPLS